MTFQLAGKVFQIAFFVAFRVAFRCIHIAFAVHHFIIPPVDYRASGNAYFEYFRVTEHQGGSHVSSEAPSVYADAFAVYVGEGFQEFNAFYLVFTFFDAKMAEGGIFKCQSTVAAATIVDGKHDIAFTCHVCVPSACAVLPSSGDALRVRTSVDVYDDGIFLGRVKVGRFHQAIMQVGGAVCRFDCSGFDAWHLVAFVRAFSSQQIGCFFEVFGVYQVDDARLVFC